MLIVAAVLSLGVCGTSLDGLARKTEIPCETIMSSESHTVVRSDINSSPAGSENGSPETFTFVEFTCLGDFPPGTEIEVWPQVEGEVPPWELPREQLPFDRNFWIMDERTGPLIRFDVTQIARAWSAGKLPNLGLTLRVLEADEMAASSSKSLTGPREPTLIYHDNRPEKVVTPETSRHPD